MLHLHLQGLPGPIAFDPEAAAIAEMLKTVLAGWSQRAAADKPAGEPFLFVRQGARGLRVERPEHRFISPEPTAVGAVCTLVVELVDAYISAAPHLGSLHAASAEFTGRLVLFPATHRTGKSTLMARLAASGLRIFSDDLLPIDLAAGEAVATGCLPRLRLPLPASASPAFAKHVKTNTVFDDGYYCYVAPISPTLHGDRAPVGAIVLLDRRDGETARLAGAPVEDVLLNLLLQDTRRKFPAADTLARYHDLAEGAKAYRLIYSGLEEAVECLDAAFADWPANTRQSPRLRKERPVRTQPSIGSHGGETFVRRPDVTLKTVGNAGFLVDPEADDIHRLNTIGLGLWRLLEQPIDLAAIVAVFDGAFPDIGKEQLDADISGLLSSLYKAGLIRRGDA